MTKATVIMDIHDVSIFLSGVMLLEAEIKGMQNLPENEKTKYEEQLPSKDELEDSLIRCVEKKKMLEEILTALEIEEAKAAELNGTKANSDS